jgi:hypothetical protein
MAESTNAGEMWLEVVAASTGEINGITLDWKCIEIQSHVWGRENQWLEWRGITYLSTHHRDPNLTFASMKLQCRTVEEKVAVLADRAFCSSQVVTRWNVGWRGPPRRHDGFCGQRQKRGVHGDCRLASIAGAAHPSYLTLALPAPKPASESGPVGVLDRQPTKGSTRDRWMWPCRDR